VEVDETNPKRGERVSAWDFLLTPFLSTQGKAEEVEKVGSGWEEERESFINDSGNWDEYRKFLDNFHMLPGIHGGRRRKTGTSQTRQDASGGK